MEHPECPRRLRPAMRVLGWLMATALACSAQPVSVSPRWEVSYPPAAGGRAGESTAVLVDGHSILVAVVPTGSNAANPTLRMGGRVYPVRVLGHDPVSRLGFFKADGVNPPKPTIWLNAVGDKAGASLMAQSPMGPLKCRGNGWVKQVGGKVLPFALLQVYFERAVPPPGSPVMDAEGRVVAMVFQKAANGNTGYAIPAEAVHRVRQDVCSGEGRLSRGWLGLALRAETQSPQVVRVLPNSPAQAAGIQTADVLQSVGDRPVADYADAANAFFYLVPGQPVRVRLLRGVEPLEFTLTPTKPAE